MVAILLHGAAVVGASSADTSEAVQKSHNPVIGLQSPELQGAKEQPGTQALLTQTDAGGLQARLHVGFGFKVLSRMDVGYLSAGFASEKRDWPDPNELTVISAVVTDEPAAGVLMLVG